MKKYLMIACCFSIQYILAVTVLERTGKKSTIEQVKSPVISDDALSNPHMPEMIRPSIHRNVIAKTFEDKDIKDVFAEIYRENFWLGTKSRSGQGSTLVTTAVIRQELPQLFDMFKIDTVLDAGCGDHYWMRTVDMKGRLYFGVDIVPEMIEKNRAHFADDNHHFLCLNVAEDLLPKADLVICRDVLAHLDVNTACKVLRNLKASGSTFLLATTHETGKNRSIIPVNHYPYDLTVAPFNLPEPLILIKETTAEESSLEDKKAMGLWLLQDLDLNCLEY
jgi:SAM-dependent methyltransferase